MDYSFTDIFDIPSLTTLLENYTETNGVVTALLDLDGNIHVKTGWQKICTEFHRVHPTSSQRCTESDTELAKQLSQGHRYNVYCCKNGLVDVAVPVMVGGEHLGNLFTGQFFFEPPDQNQFIKQGKDLGYELIPYLDALQQVPTFSEQEIKKIMNFLVSLAQVVGEMGKAKLDLLEARKSEQHRLMELEAARQQLQHLAEQDPLTGSYNRRKFNERLDQEFSRSKRYKHPLSLAMIDTDHFKTINDTYGHVVGDKVLKNIADTISQCVRNSDIVARIGGDEFCVLFPETDSESAMKALQKICLDIERISVMRIPQAMGVSCSIGLSCVDENCPDADRLFLNADKALYQAKAMGKNCVVKYISTEADNLGTAAI